MRFVMITALAAVAAMTVEGAPPGNVIQRLAWLQGCWETSSTARTVEEQWTAPRGRSMVGLSRTVRGGELVAYELVVIRERGDRLVYIAHPSGQPSAEFLSTSLSEGSAVFENPGHDFPQRIGYRRRGESLQAWIEGTKDGQARRVEFPCRRAACPGD
jgi:hypothetical protein